MTTSANENKKELNNNSQKITIWALIMITILMIFNFNNIVYDYVSLGWSATPAFIIAILIYMIPLTLIVIEFSSLAKFKGSQSGFTKWIEIGLNRKMAFITAFIFFVAHLSFYLTKLPSEVTYLGFALTGRDLTKTKVFNILVPIVAVLLFALVTFLATKRIDKITKVTSFAGLIMLIITFFFFIVALVAWFIMLANGTSYGYGDINEPGFVLTSSDTVVFLNNGVWIPTQSQLDVSYWDSTSIYSGSIEITNGNGDVSTLNYQLDTGILTIDHTYITSEAPGTIDDSLTPNYWGSTGSISYVWFATFIWVISATDGGYGLGVYANDVKGGHKQFAKGMLIGVLIVGTLYVCGIILITVFPGDTLANSTFMTLGLMFYYVFGNLGLNKEASFIISNVLIAWILAISTFGAILLWTILPIRLLFSQTDNNLFPSYFTKQNRDGVPYRGAWLQFFVIIPFLVIPYIQVSNVNQFLDIAISVGSSLGMITPIIIFIAYFNLRLNKDHEERSFKVGNRFIGLSVISVLITIYIILFIMAFFPYDPNNSSWYFITILDILALVLVFLPIYLWYLRYERVQRDLKLAIKFDKNPDLVQLYYSNNKFLYANKNLQFREEYFEKLKLLEHDFGEKKKDILTSSESNNQKRKMLNSLNHSFSKQRKILKKQLFFKEKEQYHILKQKAKNNHLLLKQYLDQYYNQFKVEKNKLKKEYHQKIANINNENVNLEIKKNNYKTYKIEYLKLKKNYKNSMAAIKTNHKKEVKIKKIEFAKIKHEIKNSENYRVLKNNFKFEFQAIDLNFYHQLNIANEKFKNAHIVLKNNYLGEKFKLRFELKNKIKDAKNNCLKTIIDNQNIAQNTKEIINNFQSNQNDYEVKVEKITSFIKPKHLFDSIIINNNILILKIVQSDKTIKTTEYLFDDINFFQHFKKKKIVINQDNESLEASLIYFVNFDNYTIAVEELYINNFESFLTNFQNLKNKK